MLPLLLRHFSGRSVVWVLAAASLLGALAKWATSAWGLLFISLAAYILSWRFAESRPLSLSELGAWLVGLDSGTQAAIMAGVFTVLGFVIAFRTAHANWVLQQRGELSASIASDLEEFFNEFSSRMIRVRSYATLIIEFVEYVTESGDSPKANAKIHFIFSQTQKLLENRQRLSEMSMEVHRHVWRHTAFLTEVGGAMEALTDCAEIVDELTIKMWFAVPLVAQDPDDIVQTAMATVNLEAARAFVATDGMQNRMNGRVGEIRGKLLQHLQRPSFSKALWILRNRDKMSFAFDEMRDPKR